MEMNEQLLKLIAERDCYGVLFWNSDLEFFINCNDFFAWGCADAEPVQTPEDVGALERAFQDAGDDGPLLYCARRRGMRPQGAYYDHIEKEHWPLFDACGPEREVTFGNPKAHP